jgi:CPA2 family monovalent cation:H+ antiporter-2
MSELSVFNELLIVLSATVSIVFVFHKLRFPAIVGFLLAGVIIGPGGVGLIRDVSEVETLAEIGVVLLLFTIGIEFSLGQLFSLRRTILWAGGLQVSLTVLAVSLIFLFLGRPAEAGIVYGFLVSLSSTAIVLKILADRQEIHAIQGRLAAGILLLQDLCIVPMMLLLPVLSRSVQTGFLPIAGALLKAITLLLIIVVAARMALPRLLHQIALLRNRELFILFIVFVCFGTAWLTSLSGLSLALGAFVAGLVISESDFSHQIVAEVLPLRDCFSGIFFISIGMLLDFEYISCHVSDVLLSLFLIVGVKGAIVFFILWRLYRSTRLGRVLALSLAQIGEFSFILAQAARSYGLLTADMQQTFMGASILSMIATPFLIQSSQRWAFGVGAAKAGGAGALEEKEERISGGHVIIIGYGLNGQNLARVLKEVGIPYRILELDPNLVHEARAAGERISFGDGTRAEVLKAMGIEQARTLVIAISDPLASSHIVSQARRLRSDLYIIVRTRYVAEIDRLYRLGANQVIPEEFETSVEIFARVLSEYHVPRNVISLQVDLIRKEHYGTLRGLRIEGKRLDQLSQLLVGTTTDTFLIMNDSPAVGQKLGDLDLRARTGATVIAVVRDGRSFLNLGPEFELQAGDTLVVIGAHAELDRAMTLLNPTDHPEKD